MTTERGDRGRLADALALWRRSQPGGRQRTFAADLIEEIEARLFGDKPHALGRLLELEEDTGDGRRDHMATRREGD